MEAESPIWTKHSSVFHYTTQEGCYGILRTGCLWASHFGSLNDISEFRSITPILQAELFQVARKLWKSGAISLPATSEDEAVRLIKEGTDAIPNAFWNVTFNEPSFGQPFVASFCGTHKHQFVRHNGLLSQWRGYGSGGGYAIEFDTAALHNLMKTYAAKFAMFGLFADAVYDEQSLSYASYRTKLEQFLDIVPTYGFVDWLQKPPSESTTQGALTLFIQLASRLKHVAFSEEHEVRIVIMRIEEGAERPLIPVKFRHYNGRVVPYIELFETLDVQKTIRRIIVGPHPDSQNRAESLRLFLSQNKIEANVTVSDIPFRSN